MLIGRRGRKGEYYFVPLYRLLALLWCCALICFAISNIYPVALVLLFAAGFLELAFNAMAQALVQLNAHEEIRGRTIGLFNMASLGLRLQRHHRRADRQHHRRALVACAVGAGTTCCDYVPAAVDRPAELSLVIDRLTEIVPAYGRLILASAVCNSPRASGVCRSRWKICHVVLRKSSRTAATASFGASWGKLWPMTGIRRRL